LQESGGQITGTCSVSGYKKIAITVGILKLPSRSALLNRKYDRIVVEIPIFRKGELW
jgi:hypothetical protein